VFNAEVFLFMHRAILVAALFATLGAPATFAEESCGAVANPMTKSAMEQSLVRRGYTQIRSLSLHNGCYEAKGFDAHGKRFELELNAATGAIHNAE